jgi:hypothetical protein
MYSLGREYSPVVGLWEKANEYLGSIYRRKFLHRINYYIDLLVLQKYSAPGRQSLTRKL